MFFEGCPPQLGCTIKLRGASEYELARVKDIIRLMICVAYHSQLEISFLMDEFAMPPSLGKSTSFPCLLESATGEEEEEEEEVEGHEGTDQRSGSVVDQHDVSQGSDSDVALQESDSSHSRVQSVSESSSKDQDSPKVDGNNTVASIADSDRTDSGCKTSTPLSFASSLPASVPPPFLISDLEEMADEEKQPQVADDDGGGTKDGTLVGGEGNDVSGSDMPPPRLFRDPLQDDTGLFVTEQVASSDDRLKSLSACFRQELKDIILCISPFITFREPFLLMPAGLRCPSRDYFPEHVYLSPLLNKDFKELDGRRKRQLLKESGAAPAGTGASGLTLTNGVAAAGQRPIQVLPSHPLTSTRIIEQVSGSQELARMLADYRAQGGRIRQRDDPFNNPQQQSREGQAGRAPVKADSEEEKSSGQTDITWATKVRHISLPTSHKLKGS